MGYSYFITRRSAEKWARENLDATGRGPIIIEELARYHQTDYKKWYVYYPLMAIKQGELNMETCAGCGCSVPSDIAWYDCGEPICPICFDSEYGTDLADRDDQ